MNKQCTVMSLFLAALLGSTAISPAYADKYPADDDIIEIYKIPVYTKLGVDKLLCNKVGSLDYSSNNYVVDGKNLTTSVSSLDYNLKIVSNSVTNISNKVNNFLQ